MFERLTPQPADKILALIASFREDTRDTKIDLGVGVYKDATGLTPVMRAVKAAEERIWQSQDTKAYTGLAGDPAFAAAMCDLILGHSDMSNIAGVATPGGTGAIRQGLELVKMAAPGKKVWLSAPTWPNHPSIVKYLGLPMAEYRYFDSATRGVDFENMMADLDSVADGDVVMLHGCCHNPTGANLEPTQEDQVLDLLAAKKAVVFVDIAYQGFGDGLTEDAAFTRKIVDRIPEVLIAASCSKNFGIYRERTGVLLAISQDTSQKALNQQTLNFLNRQNYSFPPDHGARIVTTILTDPTLRADWESELNEIRNGMLKLRQDLTDELQRQTNSDQFAFIANHRGMFSRIGVDADQVEALRKDHAIYMIGDSRINIAGLNGQTIPILAKSIAAVL